MGAFVLPWVWQPCLQGEGADIVSGPELGVQNICGPTSLSTVSLVARLWMLGCGERN